jgi:hypothetical protein
MLSVLVSTEMDGILFLPKIISFNPHKSPNHISSFKHYSITVAKPNSPPSRNLIQKVNKV